MLVLLLFWLNKYINFKIRVKVRISGLKKQHKITSTDIWNACWKDHVDTARVQKTI